MYVFAIILTIISNIFYHLSLKAMPSNAHPILSLSVAYVIAFILSLTLVIFFPLQKSLLLEIKQMGYAPFLLGIVIVGIELGFLLAYRAGWNISYAAIASNVLVTIILLIIGKYFLHEELRDVQYLGVIFAIAGVVLINAGK